MPTLYETIKRRLNSEIGLVRKDHGGRLRVCLVYPNNYRVGMSSLGYQTIYHLLNQAPDIVCERAFAPDPEDLGELQRTGAPIVSYESQTPLNQFEVIAFSVSYELDYINVARILRLAKVPVMSTERGEEQPLVLAGGAAVSINPEPLSELVDVFVMGEGEEVIGELVGALRRGKMEALRACEEVEGVYVPNAHGGKTADGQAETGPPYRATAGLGTPARQRRRYVRELEAWPTHSRILTKETEFGDLFLVEVSRGCARRCKFCVTPSCYWPLRWRSVESILTSARAGLEHRNAIGLVGAAVSDHPEIDEIARLVVGLGARLSVSSLRADSVSDTLLEALARSGAKSITIAPEAGSERLRKAIGKGIADAQIFEVLQRAAAVGMKEAKLYFMVGLPGESEADVAAIPALVKKCISVGKLSRLTAAAGAFVPKPDTPYEKEGMLPAQELSRRLRIIREGLRRERKVQLALESPNWSVIEGLLSRGDRRLGRVIAGAEEKGGNLAAWRAAMKDAGLKLESYLGHRV